MILCVVNVILDVHHLFKGHVNANLHPELVLLSVVRLQDPYANYVLQSALTVSNGQLHAQLVDAIRPYLPSLRGTPHGKRILSKINVKI